MNGLSSHPGLAVTARDSAGQRVGAGAHVATRKEGRSGWSRDDLGAGPPTSW